MIESTTPLIREDKEQLEDFVSEFLSNPCRNYAERLLRVLNGRVRKGYGLGSYTSVFNQALEL